MVVLYKGVGRGRKDSGSSTCGFLFPAGEVAEGWLPEREAWGALPERLGPGLVNPPLCSCMVHYSHCSLYQKVQ